MWGLALDSIRATFQHALPAQLVDATPLGINLFSKGGVHDANQTMEAFRRPTVGYAEPLESWTVDGQSCG